MSALLVALGAAVGAPSRYLVDRAVQARNTTGMPWGTLVVNTAGSLLPGVLAALPTSPTVSSVAATGFCGALSTYSTFSYETLRLFERGSRLSALLNVVLNLAAGLGAVWVGMSAVVLLR